MTSRSDWCQRLATMASLKNAIKSVTNGKTHRERAQPAARAKFGLLEKKKDYVQRAKNWHGKQDRLRALQEKAALRNPDEFYMHMNKASTKGGVHQLAEPQQLSAEQLAIFKSQDSAYVTHKRTVDTRKAERLKSSLHFLLEKAPNKHTVFVDDEDEAGAFDVAEHFDTVPELATRAFNRPRKDDLKAAAVTAPHTAKEMRRAMKAGTRQYEELAQRQARAKQMGVVLAHQEAERNMGKKGRKRKIAEASSSGPAQYKWKQERAT